MAWLTHLLPCPALARVLRDRDGREVIVVVVKGTFRWTAGGDVTPAAEQVPIHQADAYRGAPACTSLAVASDVTLGKPRVDLLLQSEIVLGRPAATVDVALDVGRRLRKVVRVTGERVWVTGALGRPVPTRPVAFVRMPLSWERALGQRANPVGVGQPGKSSGPVVGSRLPNFEYPDFVAGGSAATQPAGFGPLAPHWKPRADLAGTYDRAWREQRFPLLPRDFDPGYHNVAPADQQLDRYPAEEVVRLLNMTAAGLERFRLPRFDCPLALVDDGYLLDRQATVDTITVEPARRTLTLTARLVHPPRRDVLGVTAVFVGPLSAGRRRALLTGKRYCEPAGPAACALSA